MTDAQVLDGADREVYLSAVDWLSGILGHDDIAASWSRPSALSNYSVGGLAAHAVTGGVLRLRDVLQSPEPTGGHRVSLHEYFGPNKVEDRAVDDPLFVQLRAGAEATADQGPRSLLDTCQRARTELALMLAQIPANRSVDVVRVPGGTVDAREYVQTRVLEVIVHGDDLVASVPGASVGEPPAAALAVCLDLCLQLAQSQLGARDALRAFTRQERCSTDALRVL